MLSETRVSGTVPGTRVSGRLAAAAIIPHAERLIIEGQRHVAEPKTVAAVIERLLGS
jgi:hypothetical protein